jgi:NNP family nitrate/nitrite transporter-like MFS transporter
LRWLLGAVAVLALAAVTLPGPFVMVALLILCFAAMGAGNGAVFQLVPLRFATVTAVAGGLVGEISAFAGGALPGLMGMARQRYGTFAPGFVVVAAFALFALFALALIGRAWQRTWLSGDARAATPAPVADEGSVATAVEGA